MNLICFFEPYLTGLNFGTFCILQVLSSKPTVMKTTLVKDVGVDMVVAGTTGEINGKFLLIILIIFC